MSNIIPPWAFAFLDGFYIIAALSYFQCLFEFIWNIKGFHLKTYFCLFSGLTTLVVVVCSEFVGEISDDYNCTGTSLKRFAPRQVMLISFIGITV